ncbi:MAG: GDP-mannose 4,6-dehydratase [Chloroflexi bacterium]|nr:GDP-mannose 4,6-dehydratase [Chloroflexota bacterium]
MRVLITGVTGMAGSHLAEYLLTLPGVEVFGTYRWRSRMDNLSDLAAAGRLNRIAGGGNVRSASELADRIAEEARPDQLNLIFGDLTDPSSIRRLIAGLRPDRIFHLAAQSFVPTSWDAPAQTMELNVIGQINLFEAIREAGIDPLIHVAGSSEEYGLVHPDEVPMKETNPLRPLSPYAVSKVAQELLAWQYFKSYGLRTVVTRGFNHTGPRRGEMFVTSSFAKQIAQIEKGLRPPVIEVGDLQSKRDWTDVRDTVRAYWLALERGVPGEVYNVGSGVCRSVEEMLKILLQQTDRTIDIRVDPSRLRPSDVKILWCDATKFRNQTGWQPEIPFETTMRDLLNYWRCRV